MPATITSPTPKTIYSQNSGNMAIKADLDELVNRGRVSNPCELNQFLQNKFLEYKERDYQTFIEKVNVGQQIANLTEGKLVPMRHARTGQLRLVKPDGRWSDNKTVGGKFQFYVTNLKAEWFSSNPERDPICPSEQDQVEEFIADVKIIQDYYDQKFFTHEFEDKQSDEAFNFGTWIARYRFDPEVDELVCELLPFPACRWDMRVKAEESPYFIYQSKCLNSVVENLLDADVPEDDWSDNYGLNIMEQITRQGTGVRGEGKDRLYGTYEAVRGENIVTEMYLQPEVYCNVELMADEKTVSGKTLKQGRSLLEAFPKGMCVLGLNNMNTIVGIYAENHKDHIVSGVYHSRAYSGVGKGIDDAVDVYKELNDLHSQLLTYVKVHSTPAYGYNKDMVSEADARDIGKPRKNIAVDFTNAPEGVKSVNEAMQALVPSNPSQAGFEYKSELESDLQTAFQVTSLAEPMPGVQNDTATGAKIGESLAMKQLLPQHLHKADFLLRSDKIIYNLFKKYINKPKWFANKSKNGITAGKYLTGDKFADIDIEFAIVANSETPKTPFGDAQNTATLMQFSGGAQGLWELAQQDTDYANGIAAKFGVTNLPFTKTTDIARICRKRIEQAREILQQELATQQIMTAVTGQEIDNTNLAASIVSKLVPPISPKELYAPQKVKWMAELLDSDEMQYEAEEMRYIVEEMISVQLQEATLGQAQVGLDTNMGMVMARLPELVGEQIMNYQNMALEKQYEAEQAQAQAEAQQGQAQEQVGAELQKAEITDKMSEKDHERAMQMEAFKQHGQRVQAEIQNKRANQQKKAA